MTTRKTAGAGRQLVLGGIADAARRYVQAVNACDHAAPGTLLDAIRERDGALHDLADVLDEPCPYCSHALPTDRPIENTRPL